jgi:hypothetical protein
VFLAVGWVAGVAFLILMTLLGYIRRSLLKNSSFFSNFSSHGRGQFDDYSNDSHDSHDSRDSKKLGTRQ